MVEPTPQTKAEMEAGRKTLEALNPGAWAAKAEADAKTVAEKAAHEKAEADAKDAAELAHAKEVIAKHEAKQKDASMKKSDDLMKPHKDNGPKHIPDPLQSGHKVVKPVETPHAAPVPPVPPVPPPAAPKVEPPHAAPTTAPIPPLKK
jgi:hypothetical protein